ncbi:MAG: penicillin-binding protein 2 [Actinomycetales bacterium]|nr:penicillin-binding protein 2 [Actinomycetales bacterium]
MNTPIRRLGSVVTLLFALLLVGATWIQVFSVPSMADRPDNVRALYKEYGRERGPILVAGDPIAESVPVDDAYTFQRRYPRGAQYSHLTGFYSVVYGATGLENAENDLLAGTSGKLFYRRLGDLLTGREPRGASIDLTIDPKAQRAAWNALGNQRGAVVALDPDTGEVLAMVSKPGFDPDRMASHNARTVRSARTDLLNDPSRPLENRAITGRLYPPGSVFKLVTAAAALESGEFDPDSVLPGPARLDLPQTSTTLPNYSGGACGGGRVTLTQALQTSCNTAFGYLGLRLGDDAIREQAEKFGFGQELTIPLKTTPSIFPDEVDAPQSAMVAIGQFNVRTHPLQMAMVAAGIANDGVVMRPRLVRTVRSGDALEVISKPRPERFSTAVSRRTANRLTDMMVKVVSNGTGTRAQIPGVAVAGKTGTAEQGEGRPPNAWFVSFAPAENPQVAVAVVIEDGGVLGDSASGGRLGAPIAKSVMEAVLSR